MQLSILCQIIQQQVEMLMPYCSVPQQHIMFMSWADSSLWLEALTHHTVTAQLQILTHRNETIKLLTLAQKDVKVIVQNIGFIMKPGAFSTDNHSTFVQLYLADFVLITKRKEKTKTGETSYGAAPLPKFTKDLFLIQNRSIFGHMQPVWRCCRVLAVKLLPWTYVFLNPVWWKKTVKGIPPNTCTSLDMLPEKNKKKHKPNCSKLYTIV